MEVIHLIVNKSGNLLNFARDNQIGLINHLSKQEDVVLVKVSIDEDELEKLMSHLYNVTNRKLELIDKYERMKQK